MRKIKILIALSFLMCNAILTFAQSKGDKFIGTMLGMSISKESEKYGGTTYEENPLVFFEIDPGFHYFIADKFRVGVQTAFGKQMQKDEDGHKNTINMLEIGIVSAYYIKLAENFYFTPEICIGFIHNKYKETKKNISEEAKTNGFGFQFLPVQVEFRPTQHFGMSVSLLGLTYTHMKAKDVDVISNKIKFDVVINPSVGFRFYF